VASGKSTAARIFSELGVPVIDADQISRDLSVRGGRAAPAILAEFGTLDRGELRKIIFADGAKRRKLQDLLHPLIREESVRRIRDIIATKPQTKAVIYEAALLVETGGYADLAGLIVVQSSPEKRMERLIARDGIEPALARKMIAAQASDADRAIAATAVLSNNSDEASLRKQIEALLPSITRH
jgi:dephospho-CoA kinase